jgi:hypothetical protein
MQKMLTGAMPQTPEKRKETTHMEAQASTQKTSPRRERNRTMTIRATQEEKDFILKKMKLSDRRNFNLYALKMLMIGEIKNVDLTHYHELAKEVSRIGANVNQIVKFANVNGNLYPQEIAEFQERMNDIWQLLKSSLSEQR